MNKRRYSFLFFALVWCTMCIIGQASAQDLIGGDKYLIREYLPFLYHTRTPERAVESFFEEVFAGELEIDSYICASAVDLAEGIKESFGSMKLTLEYSGATMDISGLTYTLLVEDGDIATVEVAGKMSVSVSGVTQEVDFPASPVKLVRENGGWKICG